MKEAKTMILAISKQLNNVAAGKGMRGSPS
jgi:hypothetical protein